MSVLHTPLCDIFNIEHPVLCAGMNTAATAELVAAVSNCGGIGTIGGGFMSPETLQMEINLLKEELEPGKPFGVDILIPKIGGGARKTNYDYTHGNLDKLIDVIIKEKAALFVCAVGVPPRHIADKLHNAGIKIMNMIGAPHHVDKALEAGADIICAQGTEGGGHTGDVGTMVLIPMCVDKCKGKNNFWGQPVQVVAAGGIFDGRGLVSCLALGATGVWVGTRFVATNESTAPKAHKEKILKAKATSTIRTLALTGRPIRLIPNDAILYWEKRPKEMQELLDQGLLPFSKAFQDQDREVMNVAFDAANSLCGQAAGGILKIEPAKEVVSSMVSEAARILKAQAALLIPLEKESESTKKKPNGENIRPSRL